MSKIKKYSKVEASAWIQSFCSLFARGTEAVKETIKNRFEHEKEKENFDVQQKALFLIAAKYCFSGKTTISKEKIESLKELFQENSTLKTLQEEFRVDLTGLTESTESTESDV